MIRLFLRAWQRHRQARYMRRQRRAYYQRWAEARRQLEED